MSKRVKKNGGKALNYFLVPKAFNSRKNYANQGDDEDDYYVVPLIFGRLAQPKGQSKPRKVSADSDDSQGKSFKKPNIKEAKARINTNLGKTQERINLYNMRKQENRAKSLAGTESCRMNRTQ